MTELSQANKVRYNTGMSMLCALTLVVAFQTGESFYASSDRFGYTGTYAVHRNEAEAKAGRNAIRSGAWDQRDGSIYDCDGRHIVGSTKSKELAVWNAKTGRLVQLLKDHPYPIYLARLTPDGYAVLGQARETWPAAGTSGYGNNRPRKHTLLLWDIRTGKVLWRIQNGYFDAISRDGRRVYGVQVESSANIEKSKLVSWDIRSGVPLFAIPDFSPRGYLSNIVEESADGKRLLYADLNGTTVFELRTRKKLLFVDSRSTRVVVTPAALTATGDQFFMPVSNDPKSIALYSIPEGREILRAVFPDSPIKMGWMPKSEGFVAYSNGHWFSYIRGSGLADHGGAASGPMELIVSPDEKHFASWYVQSLGGKKWFTVEGYDVAKCKKLWQRSGRAVKFLPNGELVVEDSNSLRFIDIVSGRVLRSVNLSMKESPCNPSEFGLCLCSSLRINGSVLPAN